MKKIIFPLLLAVATILNGQSNKEVKLTVFVPNGLDCPYSVKANFWSPTDSIGFHGELFMTQTLVEQNNHIWVGQIPTDLKSEETVYTIHFDVCCETHYLNDVVGEIFFQDEEIQNQQFHPIRFFRKREVLVNVVKETNKNP